LPWNRHDRRTGFTSGKENPLALARGRFTACRVDDLAYESVSDWFNDHRGRVPTKAAVGFDRYIKATGSTVAEAFTALSAKVGPIIMIEEA